jgi:hypothetical protein
MAADYPFLTLFFLPLGGFAYLLIRGNCTAARGAKETADGQPGLGVDLRLVAGRGGAVAAVDRARRLLGEGTITPAEFAAVKSEFLVRPGR